MASLFGARRRRSPEDDGDDSDGSGSGRAKRRRGLSPEEGAPSPGEAMEGRSPGWFSTFVSGAKRVVSSVLFSSSEEQVSEEEEEEEEEGSEADDDGNEDTHDSIKATVPYSESKLAIEEMVMKESFSRDEYEKMVKLLQSRVIDSSFPETYENGTPHEIPRRKAGAGHDFTGAWRSLNHNRDYPESGPFPSIGPGYFSPGSPLQASPELCNAAVMEAKKWLEEKRQGLGTQPENLGPCTLNTEMLNSPVKDDKGSPVDVAKSYMQSLPPWQSPLLGSRKFKTPPSGGVHINVYERKSKLFSSAKVNAEEDFLSIQGNLEELQRARMKSPETFLEASKSRLHGSTSRLFDNDLSIFSPANREEVLGPVQSSKGSDKAAAAEPANECSLPVAPTKDVNDGAVDSVDPAPKDSDNLVHECHPASEVHPDEVPQGNHMPLTRSASAAKGVADGGGDVNSVPAEPEIHEESHMNSTSESRPKDADPQIEISLRALRKKVQTSLSGSTNKASANGLLDRSDGNSGVESSGNDNPGCTNSSSAFPPNINDTADATDGNCADENGTRKDSEKLVDDKSFENGAGVHSEEPAKVPVAPKPLRRGRKRAVRRD